ncbi:unnamed protein product [Psylliodes chrysocephalus]|uniref:MADF domain-containing protein n=1 Tax=Psylliodes chrysocephalus TaxID=3402493 RepID=A0A9P0G3U0_9CUCU|nr:unnamed protein product [Psylliodes chrysocephala]
MVDFIELYRSEPCLWQVKSADYHDRAKKDAAYNTLAKKLGELELGATKKSGLAKINNLRSAFRKEQKIVGISKKSGTSADSIYKPVLWYFDLLEASTSNLDSDSEEESADNSLPVEKDVNDYVDVEGSTSATENVPAKQQSTPISRPGLNKKRNINDDLSTEVLTTVRDHFKAPKEQPDR